MRKIINIFLSIITIPIVVVLGGILILFLLGIKPTIVTSNSMYPIISVGDVCFIDTKYPYEELKLKDIIVYKSHDQKIIHRIVEKKDGIIRTRGDNNDHVDRLEIHSSNYVGKYVFSIPKVGKIIVKFQSLTGKTMFTSAIIVLFILDFLAIDTSRKKKKG